LKGFESRSEPGAIWTYDKRLRRFRRIPIKVVAQEADYYDPDTERELSESVEGPAHATLAKLRSRSNVSSDDRIRLALYMATMIKRVPRHRRKALELMPSALSDTIGEVRAQIEQLAKSSDVDQKLVARRLAEVERAHEKLSRETPVAVRDQIRSPWPSKRIVTAVHDMTWRIVVTNESTCFLTSDNPAYFFEGYGLGKPEAELTFPLASDMALLASWQGPRGSLSVVTAKSALVKEVNRRVASGAERFVFYHERRQWIATLADRPSPFLNRILW
jgi:hypothetical protein